MLGATVLGSGGKVRPHLRDLCRVLEATINNKHVKLATLTEILPNTCPVFTGRTEHTNTINTVDLDFRNVIVVIILEGGLLFHMQRFWDGIWISSCGLYGAGD